MTMSLVPTFHPAKHGTLCPTPPKKRQLSREVDWKVIYTGFTPEEKRT